MKVLYLPLGNQPGTVQAFKNLGVDLEVFDFWSFHEEHPFNDVVSNKFLEFVERHKPNWIHMQLQMTGMLSVQVLNRAREISPGVIITNWSGDVRIQPSMEFVSISHGCDYSLISNVGQLELYAKTGCKNVRYWQTGYWHEMFYPQNKTEFTYDVAFLANMYPHSLFPDASLRYQIASRLRDTFGPKAALFGTGYPPNWGIHHAGPDKINDIYNDSLCVLSVSNFNDISHYFSDRLPIAMASGRPCLCWNFPGCESYFAHGSDLIIIHNIPDMLDQICLLKQNPDYANTLGRNEAMKVRAEHTFNSKITELAKMIGII
jgi:CheY-like chemotaxis protein